MSREIPPESERSVPNWNIANQVTGLRLLASVILFVVLHFHMYRPALVLFILGATTDWIDGYLARSRNLVTPLGRVMDPIADKIIICGTYVFLSANADSGILPWMTVVVISREFVVTVIRSFLESHGRDFSAKMPGKIKMVLQCVVAIASLLLLSYSTGGLDSGIEAGAPQWLAPTVGISAWLMVLSTVYSGLLYLPAAAKIFRD